MTLWSKYIDFASVERELQLAEGGGEVYSRYLYKSVASMFPMLEFYDTSKRQRFSLRNAIKQKKQSD